MNQHSTSMEIYIAPKARKSLPEVDYIAPSTIMEKYIPPKSFPSASMDGYIPPISYPSISREKYTPPKSYPSTSMENYVPPKFYPSTSMENYVPPKFHPATRMEIYTPLKSCPSTSMENSTSSTQVSALGMRNVGLRKPISRPASVKPQVKTGDQSDESNSLSLQRSTDSGFHELSSELITSSDSNTEVVSSSCQFDKKIPTRRPPVEHTIKTCINIDEDWTKYVNIDHITILNNGKQEQKLQDQQAAIMELVSSEAIYIRKLTTITEVSLSSFFPVTK